MLKNLFKKTFDIRDGEIRISFFMQLYIFLLITVLLMVKPTINALFLSKLGASHLPYGYILVALIAVATNYFYNRAVKKYSLRRITIGTLVFFSVSFMLLSFLMYQSALTNIALYVYYLSVSLFAVLVTSQFWIIANMVYNAREAKRLFGFIGAGAIAGGIFGGYLTSIIAPVFGNRIVILVAAFFILCCIPILQAVWKIRLVKLTTVISNNRKSSQEQTYNSPFKSIIKSKHLSYLAAIVGVGVIMAKLVDFQFSDFANRAIPNSDELASFFGFWFSSFNVVALLIQLFLTNRLLSWLGVTSNLLILPLGIALGCLLFLTFPELWVLVIIKGMDGSFKQSINKAGIELSILPIPYYIKNEDKAYIDVVVDSIATGIAGLLLIFVIRKLELSTQYITIIILFMLFAWMLLIYKLRETYFESFRNNIQSSIASAEDVTSKGKLQTSTKATIAILKSGDEKQIVAVLSRLQNFSLLTFQGYIIALLDHPSPKVKSAAIEQLFYYKKGTAIDKVKQLIYTKDDDVVYHAMDYMLHHTKLNDDQIFKSYLDHKTDYISNAALLCLAKESVTNKKLARSYNLNNRLEAKIEELSIANSELRKQEIAELMLAIGYGREPRYYSFITANFNNQDSYIVEKAIIAAGKTAHEPFIPRLLAYLADATYRKAARKALRNFGASISKIILKLDIEQSIDDDVKRYIPRVIESFQNRESVKQLMRLLSSKDFIIRLEAAKSLYKLQSKGGAVAIDQRLLTKIILRESRYYRNTINCITCEKKLIDKQHKKSIDLSSDAETDLLIARESLLDMLYGQLDQGLECVFKLLSLKYDSNDIDTAYFGLKSEIKETKINAVEFLDNLLKSKLKTAVLPLVEYHIIEDHNFNVSTLRVKVIKERATLQLLLKSRGSKMKMAVINVMQHTSNNQYIKSLLPLLRHKNKGVRLFAKNAIDEIRKANAI